MSNETPEPTPLEVVKIMWKHGEKEFLTCRQVKVDPTSRVLVLVQTDYVKRNIPLENLHWFEQALLDADGVSALKFPEQEKTVLIEPDNPLDWPCAPFDQY